MTLCLCCAGSQFICQQCGAAFAHRRDVMTHMHAHMNKKIPTTTSAAAVVTSAASPSAPMAEVAAGEEGFVQSAVTDDVAAKTREALDAQQQSATLLTSGGTDLFMDFTAASVVSAPVEMDAVSAADDVTHRDDTVADDVSSGQEPPQPQQMLTGDQVMAEAVRQLGDDAVMSADDTFDEPLPSDADAALALSDFAAAAGNEAATASAISGISLPDSVGQTNGLLYSQPALPADVTSQISEYLDGNSSTVTDAATSKQLQPGDTLEQLQQDFPAEQNGAFTQSSTASSSDSNTPFTAAAAAVTDVSACDLTADQEQNKPVTSGAHSDEYYSMQALEQLQKLAAEQNLS